MANKFTNFKFTTEGKDTLTEVLAAKGSIAITQVYTFASKLTDALVFTQLSSLSPKQIKPVGTVSAQSNTVETRLQIDNADLTSDYNLQGIALVGTFNNTNFVLGYINTNEATNVPAFSGNQVQTIALDVSFAISDTSVITINTQTAGMLTVADYNALVAFIKEQVAPLSVDKKVVHLTTNEIIDGIKTFKQKITGSISGNANTVDYINVHQITTNIDLNTITTNGNYLSVLETKTTSNKPGGTSEQYSLVSLGNMQLFSDIKTDKVYIRNQITSTTFTSWKIILEDVDQTLNAQFNFAKTPTVNNKPVAIQDDLQTETNNRTNADKDINKSLSTEVTDRKNGDTDNANAIQTETTARSQADSSAAAALNIEKATRSAADITISDSLATETTARSAADSGLTNKFNTLNGGLNDEIATRSAADTKLTKAVSDTQSDLQTETTNRTNNDNRIDSSAVHKTSDELIDGKKNFSDTTTFAKRINGKLLTPVLPSNITTFAEIASHMETYGGTSWSVDFGKIIDRPEGMYGLWGILTVINNPQNDTAGQLIASTNTPDRISTFIGHVSGSIGWYKLADNDQVIHKTGNETIQGTKTFNTTISGNISTADQLKTARMIGGVWFNGTTNINLPGVNTSGNQNTSGNAATSDKLKTPRYIGGIAFDGTSNINLPGVNMVGNQDTTGTSEYSERVRALNVPSSVTSIVDLVAYTQQNFGSRTYNVYIANNVTFTDAPDTTQSYYNIEIVCRDNIRSYIYLLSIANELYVTNYVNGKLDNWAMLPNDTSVVHKSENEIITGTKTFSSAIKGDLSGNANSASRLQTPRTIGGISFDGGSNISLPGVNIIGNQSTTGNAATATKIQNARTIGGVWFDGSANINLPGVNTQGNQNTTGNAATATKIQTARTIGGVSFDGSANINLPGVNADGNQNTSGNAGSATKLATARTITVNSGSGITGSGTFDGSGNLIINQNMSPVEIVSATSGGPYKSGLYVSVVGSLVSVTLYFTSNRTSEWPIWTTSIENVPTGYRPIYDTVATAVMDNGATVSVELSGSKGTFRTRGVAIPKNQEFRLNWNYPAGIY